MKVASAINKAINARGLQLECVRVLYQALLMPVLLYDSKRMIWREKEMSRIRAVQMDNLRGLLGIGRTDRVPNAQIRELCGVAKGADESVLYWFGHIERMENIGLLKWYMSESVWVFA